MARVLTNNTSFQVAEEDSLGVLPSELVTPGTNVWRTLQPNDISTFGPTLSKVERDPISKSRQRAKGATVDLDSAVEFEHDLTMETAKIFAPGFVFASFTDVQATDSVTGSLVADATLPTLLGEGFTHSALSSAIPVGSLIQTRGFTNSVNNGLFEVGQSSTTETEVTPSPGILDETPTVANNAKLEVAGFRFTDLTWTDATTTIGSAGVDLTTLGLTAGQTIRVGNSDTTNEFAGGSVYGRIVSITAASIVLDKVTNIGTGTLSGGGDVGASSVDVMYGRFLRNVSVDDADFVEKSYRFEAAWENLQNPDGTGDEYEYAKGNFANAWTFNLALADKATMTMAFVGTDTDPPTTTRVADAATPAGANETEALNTSSDIAQLRILNSSDAEITSCFKSVSLTLNNSANPEKCLGTLGALFMNTGNFEVDLESQVLFTDSAILSAIRDNETVTMDFILINGDGGIAVDLPSMTLGDGSRELPEDESVLVNMSGVAFEDATLGTSIGISFFPNLPAAE